MAWQKNKYCATYITYICVFVGSQGTSKSRNITSIQEIFYLKIFCGSLEKPVYFFGDEWTGITNQQAEMINST